MLKSIPFSACAIASFALLIGGVAEAGQGRVKARGTNGVVSAGAGPNGGAYARGAGCVPGSTSAQCASGGAVKGPNGGMGARASTSTINQDGSATRQGGFAAQNQYGASATSSGNATRNADGTVSGARSTNATNANGATYQGATTYDSTNGVTHTGTCTNSSGAVVACPR